MRRYSPSDEIVTDQLGPFGAVKEPSYLEK
jgi:hypothetical protein